MKFIVAILVPPLAGCSGLNVQWAATATYNTPATTTSTMTPGATTVRPVAPVKPAP